MRSTPWCPSQNDFDSDAEVLAAHGLKGAAASYQKLNQNHKPGSGLWDTPPTPPPGWHPGEGYLYIKYYVYYYYYYIRIVWCVLIIYTYILLHVMYIIIYIIFYLCIIFIIYYIYFRIWGWLGILFRGGVRFPQNLQQQSSFSDFPRKTNVSWASLVLFFFLTVGLHAGFWLFKVFCSCPQILLLPFMLALFTMAFFFLCSSWLVFCECCPPPFPYVFFCVFSYTGGGTWTKKTVVGQILDEMLPRIFLAILRVCPVFFWQI